MSGINYRKVIELYNDCLEKNLSATDVLISKVKEICPEGKLEEEGKNLLRRVRRHEKNGGNMDDLLPDVKSMSKKPTLGPFCNAAGITDDDLLLSSKPICISYAAQNKGLVFELEKFRRNSGSTVDEAVSWSKRIWGIDSKTSMKNGTIHHSWSSIYHKTQYNSKRRKSNVKYHHEHYEPPRLLPSFDEKVADKLAKSVTPLVSSATVPTLLSVAKTQGKIMGKYTKALQSETASWQHETELKECALASTQSELQGAQEELTSIRQKLRATEMALDTKYQELQDIRQKNDTANKTFCPKNVKRRLETRDKKIKKMKEDQKNAMTALKRQIRNLESAAAETNAETEALRDQLQEANEEIEQKNKEKKMADKKASRYKMKTQELTKVLKDSEESDILKEVRGQLDFIENENEELKVKLTTALSSNKLSVFERGKYNNDIRETYMELMAKGVASRKCGEVIETVLQNLTDTTPNRLPKPSTAREFRAEAAALAKIQCGVTILASENNTVHLDGTKKRFREYNVVNVTTGDGKSLSLGYDEMAGGAAERLHGFNIGCAQ